MLWELAVSELRYRAVLEVLDGATVTSVARRFGVAGHGSCVAGTVCRYRRGGEPAGPLESSAFVSASDEPGC